MRPLGRKFGIKEKKCEVTPKYNLENAYDRMLRTNGRTQDNQVDIARLAKEANLAERQVERWMRHRNQKSKSNKLKKFSESGWLFICYTFTSVVGIAVLWDVPTSGVWWYYMLETALYASCLVTQFIDNKRKAGKVWLYSKKTTLLHITFVIFLLVWIVTRLGILPFWIMKSGLYDSGGYGGVLSGSIIFSFISVLLVMHVLWTGYILKMLHRLLFPDSQDDPRSDVDSDDADTKAD